MGDVEIQIRRSKKTADENKNENHLSTSVQSSCTSYCNSDQEKKNIVDEERSNTNQAYWDYSESHGKSIESYFVLVISIINYLLHVYSETQVMSNFF